MSKFLKTQKSIPTGGCFYGDGADRTDARQQRKGKDENFAVLIDCQVGRLFGR